VRQEGTGVNLKEAAARLGVHYQTAYRWVRSGELAAVRVGARYEVSDAAIHQFVATRHSVLRQAVPRGSAGHERSADTPDEALQDLEAMAADPLVSLPALTAFAARRGREVLGDLCLVAVTRPDGTIERAAMDHLHASRAAFAAAALSVTGPRPPRIGALMAPVLTDGAVVRIPHVPQDRLRAGLRPELRQYLADHPVIGMLAAPIRIDGAVRGMVVFTRDTPADPYTENDEEFAVRFAERVGALVQTSAEIEQAWTVREDLARSFREWLAGVPLGTPFDPASVRTLLDRSPTPLAVVVFDPDGKIIGINRAMEGVGGFGPDELIGRTFADLVAPDDAEAELENLGRLASGELDYHDFHADRRRASGQVVAYALHRVAVRHLDSSLACVISVGRPVRVTDRIKDLIGVPSR
jgi:PAS domain S-box-containing protein/excisionase family DNA binding protein